MKKYTGRYWGQEEKETTEDEMAGWHHQLDGRESEWTPGVGDGQGGLACCNSWGCGVGHDRATELNWTELKECPVHFKYCATEYHYNCIKRFSPNFLNSLVDGLPKPSLSASSQGTLLNSVALGSFTHVEKGENKNPLRANQIVPLGIGTVFA